MLLVGTAVRLAGAYFFGAYLDKRELQGVLARGRYDHSTETDPNGEFWLDYVADLGDGFDATYSVAWLLSRPSLRIAEETLPRGQVLVMGGDQVYPTAAYAEYEDRFQGPYRAALPTVPAGQHEPSLYALPGNHDWYDGLTAFLRMFGRRRPIGGRRTRQSRSYFALKLPRRWWLFAVDGQLSSYIDEPQLEYFEAAASEVEPGDRVLLCVSEPDWIRTPGDPDAYTTIDYFLRTVIQPTGASCDVVLSGDKHHYARYARLERDGPNRISIDPAAERGDPDGTGSAADPDGHAAGTGAAPDEAFTPATTEPDRSAPAHLITCGGGGAYLADTSHLPPDLWAPSDQSVDPQRSASEKYQLVARYPSAERSRSYRWGIFGTIMRRNPGFSTFLGLVHVLLLMAYLAVSDPLFAWVSVGVSALVVAGATALAGKPKGDTPAGGAVHRALGITHGLAHLALAALGAMVWTALPLATLPWVLPGLAAFLVYGPVAAVLAAELVALYLWVAGHFGVSTNELFAGQGIENSKAFLRIRIGVDGSLTIHPVGLEKVCHQWRAAPEDPPDAPWIAPRTPLTPHLIEPPIRLPASAESTDHQPGATLDATNQAR